MLGSDVCYAPVLSLSEAPKHPHNVARQTFVDVGGVTQPAPAPRFSRTAPQVSHGPHPIGADGSEVLADAGFSISEIRALRDRGVLL
jgi:alpha-methylacyl-CoA racemase